MKASNQSDYHFHKCRRCPNLFRASLDLCESCYVAANKSRTYNVKPDAPFGDPAWLSRRLA